MRIDGSSSRLTSSAAMQLVRRGVARPSSRCGGVSAYGRGNAVGLTSIFG